MRKPDIRHGQSKAPYSARGRGGLWLRKQTPLGFEIEFARARRQVENDDLRLIGRHMGGGWKVVWAPFTELSFHEIRAALSRFGQCSSVLPTACVGKGLVYKPQLFKWACQCSEVCHLPLLHAIPPASPPTCSHACKRTHKRLWPFRAPLVCTHDEPFS